MGQNLKEHHEAEKGAAYQPSKRSPAVGEARGEHAHKDLDEDDGVDLWRSLPEGVCHEDGGRYLCQQHLSAPHPEQGLAASPAHPNRAK